MLPRFLRMPLLGLVFLCAEPGFPQELRQDSSSLEPVEVQPRKSLKQPKGSRKPQKAGNFYQNLGEDMRKRKVTKMIYNGLFRISYGDTAKIKEQQKENPYSKYQGKIIRYIIIKRLDIFGTSIQDTTKMPEKKFQTIANDLHIQTQRSVIRRNLLFNEGALLDPSEIENNERIIRGLRFIKDARILVIPTAEESPFVDLIVLTIDVYPISFEVSPRGLDQFRLGVNHINLLGLGYEIDNEFQFDSDQDQEFGYDGIFRIPNLRGTFVSGEVRYANTAREDFTGVRIFRNFITPDIKNAGGLEISTRRIIDRVQLDDTLFVEFPLKYRYREFWLGQAYRSFYNPPLENVKERLRIVFAGRAAWTDYLERPAVSSDTNQLFQDNLLVLGSIGLSHREYFKDQLIFAFGITEDVPEGYLYELTAGPEFGEFFDRWYLGAQLAKGKYLRNRGYLNVSTEIGGFFRRGSVNQTVVSGTLQGFTRLYDVGKTQFRQFLGANYTIGKRRFESEYIDIRDQNGIRGLKSSRLRGRQRLVFSTESVFFTPIRFIGFRLATMTFADLGWITPDTASPFAQPIQAGLGIGVRLKNDNLAFRTFQLSFSWFPNAPADADSFDFRFSSVQRLGLNDFDVQKPDVLMFR